MNKKNKKAFTIIETLTTLLVITIMITAPLTFMYKSYKYSEFVNSKIISTALAQEGLELAISIRNGDLQNFIDMADECRQGCMIDWDGEDATPVFNPCYSSNDETDCKLYSDSSNGELFRSLVSGNKETDQHRYIKFTANGTRGYLAESVAWAYVENIKVEAKIVRMFFEIEIIKTNI